MDADEDVPIEHPPVDQTLLDRARGLIDASEKILVLTGAGISTDSGIPDFRGPNGIWTKNPEAEKASNIRFYVSDAEVRKKNWALRAEGRLWANVEPNTGHHALVSLQERGILHTLITQNVDELHQRAGMDPGNVVEIHGTTRKAACLECEYRDDIEMVLERVRSGEDDPMCTFCGGILKSATISFGQNLVYEDLQRAEMAANECDLMLAVGSTLAVYPIANVVPIAASHGAPVVILNGDATQFDAIAEVVINGGISENLPYLCRAEVD